MTVYYQDEAVTLYRGDCREVLPTLADKSIEFVFTDPPYGHNNNDGDLISRREAALGLNGGNRETRPIANDGPEANDLFRWSLGEYRRLLRGGGCCCCCCGGGGGPDPQFGRWALWMDEVIGFKQAVVWDKGGLGMGWHYRRSYEFVLVGEVPGAACHWFGDNSVSNVVRINKIIPSANEHPTEKPVALAAHFIRLHSAPGETVLDPFAGRGSTLLAAKLLGRRAIGVEIERRWCEAIVERLRQAPLFVATPPSPTQLAITEAP